MTMKKLFATLLACAMLLALLAGCGGAGQAEASAAPSESAAASETPAASEAAASEAPAEESAPSESAAAPEESAAQADSTDFTAHKALVNNLTAEFPIAEDESLSLWLAYESASLKNVEGSDIQNILSYKLLEELTGVHLDITIADRTTASEKFNIMVAAEEYTDLLPLALYTAGVDAAIADNVATELTDVIDQYCPNYKAILDSDPDIKEACMTTEGQFGEFYRIKDGVTTPTNPGAFIRMDWLEALGMAVPATYDELEQTLLAFKTEFGATEPLMLISSIIPTGSCLIAGYDTTAAVSADQAPGGNGATGFYQVDGVVTYGALTENFKEFTKMLKKWYSEGLISDNSLTRSQNPFGSDITDPVLQGKTGLFYSNQPFGDNYNGMDETGTINFFPVRDVGKTADQQMHFFEDVTLVADDGDLAITTNCENVELAAKYLDSLYSRETSLIINYGEQGVTWDFDENGEPQFLQSGLDQFESAYSAMAAWTTQSLPCIYAESRLAFTFGEGARAAFDAWKTNKDNSYAIGSKFAMTAEETEQISTISTDILTYISEHYWKFVTGEEDIDASWDSYVDTINTMGYETMREVVQTAYDRAYK